MKTAPSLTQLLGIEYPIIMAPMFLVSNVAMIKAAADAGITGSIPALNFRTIQELEKAIVEIKSHSNKPFGINLIVNKSNIKYKEQLECCVQNGVDYFITSLGSPKHIIETAHKKGIKVFCDVTDVHYAQKVVDLGADALIAVNSVAGGHAGKLKPEELIPQLVNQFDIPVISAGGVSNSATYKNAFELGAAGVSVGTIFIASTECGVSQDYKQALVDYSAKDVVMTTKLSGTPCTVINTPYVQQVGTEQSKFEQFLNSNKQLKKLAKMFTFYTGMKKLEKAAFSTTYKTVWCAGPSIENVHSIKPIAEIVRTLVN